MASANFRDSSLAEKGDQFHCDDADNELMEFDHFSPVIVVGEVIESVIAAPLGHHRDHA
jgi:hypothetical protein